MPPADDWLRRASEVAPRPVSWFGPGYFPRRGVTVIVGDAGQGKSLLAVALCAMATTGHELFGGEERLVLLNSLEDDLDATIRPRLDAAGANLDRVMLEAIRFNFPRDLERLELLLSRQERSGDPVDAVVFDSAIAHVPRYTQPEPCSDALEGLHALAASFDIAVVLIHHLAVKGGRSVWTSFGGAYALRRVPRAIYLFGQEPAPDPLAWLLERMASADDGQRKSLLVPLKLNVAGTPPGLAFGWRDVTVMSQSETVPTLVLEGETRFTSDEVFEQARRDRGGNDDSESLVEQAARFCVETLSNGPKSVNAFNALAKEVGLSLRTVERARARIKIEAIPPVRLQEVLSDLFELMTPEERRGWWLRLPPTPDTVPPDWR